MKRKQPIATSNQATDEDLPAKIIWELAVIAALVVIVLVIIEVMK